MRLAQAGRDVDPLAAPEWRHLDVGQDHVGPFALDRRAERVRVLGDGDDVELWIGLEQLRERLAHEVAVLGKDEAYRHGRRA